MRKITSLLVLVCLFMGVVFIDSCKKDVVVPTLTTTTATSVTTSSATSGGVITNNGGADVTKRGVCWSTSQNPTVSGATTNEGAGSGSFTSNLTGLTANTKYYVKAYATNSAGTAYGNEISFTTTELSVPTLTTTAATAITLTSATTGGTITSEGGTGVTARGICWATTADPSITNDKTSDGTGPGSFESLLSGLTPATTYHIRAYATNSVGTAYGTDLTFTTLATSAPVLTTAAITGITLTGATTGGNVTSEGGVEVTARGVCWATTAAPTVDNDKTSNGSGPGAFVSEIAGLNPGVMYYVRAYATNSVGTAYGNEVSFTTTALGAPILTTTAISAITFNSAKSGGNITDDGGTAVTARGVCYGTATLPDITGTKTSDAAGSGPFVSDITGLTPGTPYYVRAYATNVAGTSYGAELTFTTSAVGEATLTTTAATLITQTTATSGGNITDAGGGTITEKGVCWALTADPTTNASKTMDGPGPGIFTSELTGLLPATEYHIRAYAINSFGTAYGNDLTFTTGALAMPTVTTAAISAITQISATSGGDVTNTGGAAVTARGVCYATTTGPTIANTVTTDGNGPGAFVSNLASLAPGTTYYVKAYATNSEGTAYGAEVSFTTNPVVLATLTTNAASAITLTAATSGGNITSDGGAAIMAKGVCFALTENPTILTGTVTTDGAGDAAFTSSLASLTAGEVYYVRAYATNSLGTGYGNQVVFSTQIADVEGTPYKTVVIGTQVWMAENLKTITYNTGTAIPNVTDNAAWAALTTGAYSWFNNNETVNKPLYGAMYNFFAVNTNNLCMTGWHVPFDEDFKTLESHLGITDPVALDVWGWRGTDQGSQLKNTTGWLPGENGTNTTGFSAVPGGYRFAINGAFNDLMNLTYFWTNSPLDATRSWYRLLDGSNADIYRAATENTAGKYIRCVKD